VLAAAIGQSLHLGEIADVLGWTTSRVRSAADQLVTRTRPGAGTRLVDTGDTLTLDLRPGRSTRLPSSALPVCCTPTASVPTHTSST
jgi:hypothetical protein